MRIHPDRINFARWLTPGRNLILSTDAQGWQTIKFQMESDQLAQMLVFGLGAACEVVEPLSLKEAVSRACQELLKQL
ncbi:MAG: WYL domain-containing protein [Caldilinea sp. CFX5]|nr:WYL domain-containing protein [Caldilinea sp. CFX5]